MSATTKIWSNGIPPTCEDDDLNGFKLENNNLIIGSGQSLSTADNQQTHKAVAHYAGVGDFYVDSGTADTYVLSVTGVQVAPPTYASGMRIRFVAGNANTGGAATVNVAGLGVKSLKRDSDGANLVAGDISTSAETRAYYDGTNFRVTTQHGKANFRGCLVVKGSGNVSIAAGTTESAVFSAATYDTESPVMWTITNSERVYIPAGVTKIRVTQKLRIGFGSGQVVSYIGVNGTSVYVTGSMQLEAALYTYFTVTTQIIEVVGGTDYITSDLYNGTASSVDINIASTGNQLGVEIIE